jgi:hypothetical protein
LYDELDPLEREKDAILATKGIRGGKAELKFFREVNQSALELLRLEATAEEKRNRDVYDTLKNDRLVEFALKDAVANVLCPAAKLWNTGTGANSMREALSLMGGYGITEDCPGFLAYKWMDSQLEATYEGPEAVQRRNLSVTMTNELFLAQYRQWIGEMRRVAEHRPGTGACTLATAGRHRCRRWSAVSERSPRRDLSAGRRAWMVAGHASADAGLDRVGNQGSREPSAGGRTGQYSQFLD